MKYFVIADIHGCYDDMIKALNKAGFDANNENHTLVTAGDLLDRGAQPREVLEYVLGLPRHICIVGNHEWNMERAISHAGWFVYDDTNGTIDTACALTNTIDRNAAVVLMRDCDIYNRYIRECYYYLETDNYIVTHGWVPCLDRNGEVLDPDWRNGTDKIWNAASWLNGMESWFYGARPEKTVVCGHWNVMFGHYYLHNKSKDEVIEMAKEPPMFIDDGIVALDAGTPLTHHVNVFVFEEND